jgi:hypothetical protein
MNRTVLRALVGAGIVAATAGLTTIGSAGDSNVPELEQARVEASSSDEALDRGAPGEKPGGKGQCTAMELDGTVILVEDAPPKHDSHDYVACGKALKLKLEPILCARGKGLQRFLYQISDNKPSKSSIRCK